jgi:prophage DNA circulation protein
MADWLDYIQESSWRGVPFGVFDSSQTGGRKIAMHTYPFRDQPWVEDLGLANKEFRIRGFLVGADVAAQENAMHAVCALSGPGLLVHPTLGAITVSLTSFSSSIEAQAGRVCALEFTFIQGAAGAIFPSAITDAISAISDAADVAELAASGDYASALATVSATGGSFANSALGITGSVTSAVAPFVSTATAIAGDASLITSAVSSLTGADYGRYNSGALASTAGSTTATVSSVLAGVTTARTAITSAASTVTSLAALV